MATPVVVVVLQVLGPPQKIVDVFSARNLFIYFRK
jgi:hypothetical protein